MRHCGLLWFAVRRVDGKADRSTFLLPNDIAAGAFGHGEVSIRRCLQVDMVAADACNAKIGNAFTRSRTLPVTRAAVAAGLDHTVDVSASMCELLLIWLQALRQPSPAPAVRMSFRFFALEMRSFVM